MLTITVIAVLLALALYQVYVGMMLRKHSPNWFILIICGGLAVFMVQDHVRWVMMNNTGTRVVQEVSGNSEGVLVCHDWYSSMLMELGNILGKVSSDKPNDAIVTHSVCNDFRSWLEKPVKVDTPLNETVALTVIIHEGIHVGGEYNESVTDCLAMKVFPQVATGLGASEDEAHRMLRVFKEDYQPYKPSEYQGGVC